MNCHGGMSSPHIGTQTNISPKATSESIMSNTSLPILCIVGFNKTIYSSHHQQGVNYNNLVHTVCLKWNFPVILNTSPTSLANKFDEFTVVLKDKEADIACITETWFQDRVPDDPFNISGYHPPIRKDRSGRIGGGVMLYIRDNLVTKHHKDLEEPCLEAMWLTIKPCRLPRKYSILIVGAIYYTPKPTPNGPMLKHIW